MKNLTKTSKKINSAAQYLLGIIFIVFGATGLLSFLGIETLPPPDFGLKMKIVMKGLVEMGYLMPLVKTIEIVGGVLLLSSLYTNLAILLLLPITINILGVHIFVEPSGLPLAIIIAICLGILIFLRSDEFKGFIFKK